MRTLYEIITSAKDGDMPTHEECYWAMLCYEIMFNMDHRNLREELSGEKPTAKLIKNLKLENSHKMYNTALNKSPRDYLGKNYDPGSAEYQKLRKLRKLRKLGNKIFDKVIGSIEQKG